MVSLGLALGGFGLFGLLAAVSLWMTGAPMSPWLPVTSAICIAAGFAATQAEKAQEEASLATERADRAEAALKWETEGKPAWEAILAEQRSRVEEERQKRASVHKEDFEARRDALGSIVEAALVRLNAMSVSERTDAFPRFQELRSRLRRAAAGPAWPTVYTRMAGSRWLPRCTCGEQFGSVLEAQRHWTKLAALDGDPDAPTGEPQ